MERLIGRSLEARFVVTVGIGLLLFAAIAGVFTYGYSYRQQLELADSLQQQLVNTIQSQAEVAAFAANAEIARGVLEGLVSNPIILAARIESTEGFKAEVGSRRRVDFAKGRRYALYSPVDHIERIGAVVVVQNDDRVFSLAANDAVFQTLLMLVQLLTGSVIMAVVLRILLINPIIRLAQAMAAIQPGSARRLTVEEKHAKDEIGMLSSSANALLEAAAGAITKLKHQNNLLSSLLKNLPVGVHMVEVPSGKPLMANEAAARLLGPGVLPDAAAHDSPEVFGCYRLGSGEIYPRDATPIVMAMGGATSHVDDLLVKRPDGSETLLEMFGSPVTDEQGLVWAGLVSVIDITERKRMEEQIRQLAFHDSLTELPNRRLLIDRLSQSMAASKRSGCFGALMFLDLDDFKPLNDRYGHEVGDRLLIEAAGRLRACVRAMDTVARFVGDEFVVMISELDGDRAESTAQALTVAEKIRRALAEPYALAVKTEGQVAASIEHVCTASIGVALFNAQEASQDDTLKWADTAMYQAKAAGSNLIRLYGGEADAAGPINNP